MPSVLNNNVKIHYQVEGEGPAFVLLHPFIGSLEDFYELGFVHEFKDTHRLILVDSRGHGGSDKPHHPDAYMMEHRVNDIVAVLDDLKIEKAHFFGYSMGGRIGFSITTFAPGRFHSLVIGGAQHYRPEKESEPHPWVPFLRQGIKTAIDKYIEMRGDRISPERIARLLTNDPEAIIAILSFDESLDPEPDLPAANIPCLVYAGDVAGEHDAARRSASLMPNAAFISLPGIDHYDGLRRSDLVIPIVKDFLSKQFGA